MKGQDGRLGGFLPSSINSRLCSFLLLRRFFAFFPFWKQKRKKAMLVEGAFVAYGRAGKENKGKKREKEQIAGLAGKDTQGRGIGKVR